METSARRERDFVPWMNGILIAVNVAVFVIGYAVGSMTGNDAFFFRKGMLYAPLLLKGVDFYRLVSSIFLHANAVHIFNNMVVQFAGGEIVERNVGHVRFAVLYLLSGIGGNIFSVLYDWRTGSYGYSVGASGAVFGLIGALLYLILRTARDRAMAGRLAGMPPSRGISPAMRSLLLRAGFMTVYLLYSGWQNPVINQAAHVGGLVCGFVLCALLMRGREDIDLRGLLQR